MNNFKVLLSLLLVSSLSMPASFAAFSVPNKSITQRKLASRATGSTVGAGGVAISASCGSFSTSSSSETAVTNMSVTLTSTGRPVYVALIPDGSTAGSEIHTLGSAGNGFIKIYRNGTAVAVFKLIAFSGSPNIPFAGVGFMATTDLVAAGSYTYNVVAYNDTGPQVYITNMKLLAYEL